MPWDSTKGSIVKPDKQEIEELQEKILKAIGRNVLILQKMEGMLKSLVVVANSKFPTGNLESAVRKRQMAVSKMPMGRLVNHFVRSVHPNGGENARREETSAKGSFEFSFTFEDGAVVEELEASLRMVVEERNQLIHTKLIDFDPKSLESCRDLAGDLEDQRQRIKPQFEALAAICATVRDGYKVLTDNFGSVQFEGDSRIAANRGQEADE